MARVLVVDDEEAIRKIVGTYAENDGHTVAVACNASEARDLLQREIFDIVVSDIVLPRQSGVLLLEHIRETQPDVQVIMMTGDPEVGTAVESVRQGAFDYLAKPISREAITKVLMAAAVKKDLIDKNRQLEKENRRHREHLEELVEEQTKSLRDSKKATDRLLGQQVAINKLSLALGEERDLDSIYHTIYKHVSQMMDTHEFIVSFFDDEKQLIRAGFLVDEGLVTDVSHFPTIPLEQEGHGTQSHVIRTGKPLNISNWRAIMEKTDTTYAFDEDGNIIDGVPTVDSEKEWTRSGLLVPMKVGGAVIGVLQVQSLRTEACTRDDEELLTGLASVTSVAIENARLLEEIRQALDGTVSIVGAAVEIRDPYTAGHQRRVAELACTIGKELGLLADRIKGLRVACLLHDIGKMSIPAEILSKPTRLTDIEFSLIQGHPQVAYDLLKRIRFQWPVAQIVLQHHERMDGSGYPQGLKGDEILLEARIIATADTVEAMSSHRPYRAGLGIAAALEEIESKRGLRYDSDVADACLRVFDAGFTFSYGDAPDLPM